MCLELAWRLLKVKSKYVYYTMSDYTGDEFEDAVEIRLPAEYDLSDSWDLDSVIDYVAMDYHNDSGFESESWNDGSCDKIFTLWDPNGNKLAKYSVYVDWSPSFISHREDDNESN